jgi:hypothetical protein
MTSLLRYETENQIVKTDGLKNSKAIIEQLKQRASGIGEIALSKYPTITKLVNKYTYKETFELISNLVAERISNLNVGKDMTANQIKECAESLMGTYHTYKLDDFYKCLSNGIMGKYNPNGLFDRIDISVIFGWFKQYDVERLEAIENERINSQRSKKVNVMDIDTEAIKKALPLIDKSKETKSQDSLPLVNEQEQEFMRDFDKLPQTTFGGKRFVEIEGKMLDLTEYLNYRYEQEK